MLRIKPIFCRGICILYFTALTAQLPVQKNKNINNVTNHHVYQQKRWNIKQALKDSVLFKYESDLDHSSYLAISHLSMTYISFIEQSPLPHLSVFEKLQAHLQKNLLQPYKYIPILTSCWDPDFFRRYEILFSYKYKPFFKYQ